MLAGMQKDVPSDQRCCKTSLGTSAHPVQEVAEAPAVCNPLHERYLPLDLQDRFLQRHHFEVIRSHENFWSHGSKGGCEVGVLLLYIESSKA